MKVLFLFQQVTKQTCNLSNLPIFQFFILKFIIISQNKLLRRAVSYEEGENLASKNNILFLEASAKTAQNIENV